MIERQVDIWLIDPVFIRCITTNGFIKKDDSLVMGRGVALQAKDRYPDLPFILGKAVKKYGNHVYYVEKYNIASFPTKHVWWDKSDIELIKQSCIELEQLIDRTGKFAVLPRPGCSNGKLNWLTEVKPAITSLLSDRVAVIYV